MTTKVLSIPFTTQTEKEVLHQALTWANGKTQHHIATPNPEILLKTLKDQEYKKIIQNTSINIPDGIGILWATTYLSKVPSNASKAQKYIIALYTLILCALLPKSCTTIIPQRITGTDLLKKICLHKSSPKVFLLGAQEGVASRTKEIFEKQNTKTNIVGVHSGSPTKEETPHIVSLIEKTKPQILFVAYGAPAQEKWIHQNLGKMPSVKIAIGVGGAFDFIGGKRKRAPLWMRKVGLEWLFRLIQQPSRLKRIYNATIKFPLEVIKHS